MITLENMRGNLQPAAERNVRWEIIRGRIIEKEMIKLEDHDIEDIVESEAERLKRDKATVKEMVLNNANIHNSLLVKKVMDFLMDFAETNDVPFEEYEKRMQTEEMLNQMSYLDDVNEEGEEVENKDEE
jgi:FKBP-type peptidyl-prolyl cis-trans isomerase (trigger factor)